MSRCLDTTFLVDVLRGHPGALEKGRLLDVEGEAVFLPAPVLAEFMDGAYLAGGPYLTRALQLVGGRDVLPLDAEAGSLAGRVSAELQRKGSPLPMLDLLIAAISLRGHHVLLTRDRGFSRIPGLALETY